MTRGGGGQNLIGARAGRAARRDPHRRSCSRRAALDGAEQFFTRMRDFGYSKNAEETFAIWGHDEALADVVWVIRTFQPDVIITRFDEQPPEPRPPHGVGDPRARGVRRRRRSEALPRAAARGVKPWQAKRLLNNVRTGARRRRRRRTRSTLDVGGYDARLGLGYGELAARSRSQHKSQGFGVPGERGPNLEYFVPLAGERAAEGPASTASSSAGRASAPAAEPLAKALAEARKRARPRRARARAAVLLDAQRALERCPTIRACATRGARSSELIAAARACTCARPRRVAGRRRRARASRSRSSSSRAAPADRAAAIASRVAGGVTRGRRRRRCRRRRSSRSKTRPVRRAGRASLRAVLAGGAAAAGH